jgi:hypothetical protein
MGCMMYVLRPTFLTFAILLAQMASAVRMDETTHDMVIHRLELGIDGMEDSAPERNGIILRLGDLYADRARLKSMNEVQDNCKDCHGALDDRKKAIALYQQGLKAADKSDQGKYLLQIAHLYALNDEAAKAAGLYAQILKAKRSAYSSEVRAIAFTSVAEAEFRAAKFKEALRDFRAARKEGLKIKALVEFRIAWCQLNLGNNVEATQGLIRLLHSPDLLATQTTDGKTVDATFVQDISHDLAIFLAHGEVGPRQIDLLKELSPAEVRKSNLHLLATETDRLGKKSTSLIVWAAYVDLVDVTPAEKLEVQTRVAQISYDMDKQESAANAFEKALQLWRKDGCSDAATCDELKQRLRKFVIGWHKAQSEHPTANLLRTYTAYVEAFPNDTEMLHWAGIIAKGLKQPAKAADLFHRAAVQAAAELQKNPTNKEMQTIFDSSLLTEIEMAEASKDIKAREQAYNFYLQVNPNGSQAFEVRYQRAHVFYDSNRFQEAFSEFHYLASQPANAAHHDLQVKSADLALDCLVALKDDQSLQVRGLEYARAYPERKTEYLNISRKATMNLVAQNINSNKTATQSDYKASLAALGDGHLENADDKEKIKFYKDKLVIAQKALNLPAVRGTAEKLLAVKSLNAEDREWTMAQQVWAAELELNFNQAYQIAQNLKMKDLSRADRELRLALLAELAGLPTRKHHEAYLHLATNLRSANLVRITMIKGSSRPWQQLDQQLRYLKQTPDLLAPLALEVFAQHKDFVRAQKLIKTTRIAQYPDGQTLQRHLDLNEFANFDHKISSQRIISRSDKQLKKTLKERMALVDQSEKRTQTAFRRHDWTLQVLGLTQLARENRRLARDILSLPVPRQLSAQDRMKYQQLVRNQSQPYLARAEKIDGELNQMWSQSNSVQNLQNAYMTATSDLQKLYRDEIVPLAQSAPLSAKNRLRNLLNTPYRRPSQRDIMVARHELQGNPFDLDKAEHLRELENQGGHPAMVAYLDERIAQIKKGKTL